MPGCIAWHFVNLGFYNYFKKPKPLIIGGSLASPLQIEKKQMILTTASTNIQMTAAKGTIIVQQRRSVMIPVRVSITVNLRACLTWNAA